MYDNRALRDVPIKEHGMSFRLWHYLTGLDLVNDRTSQDRYAWMYLVCMYDFVSDGRKMKGWQG